MFLSSCQDVEWSASGLVIWAIILSVLIINSATFQGKRCSLRALQRDSLWPFSCFREISTLLWSKRNTCQCLSTEEAAFSSTCFEAPGAQRHFSGSDATCEGNLTLYFGAYCTLCPLELATWGLLPYQTKHRLNPYGGED